MNHRHPRRRAAKIMWGASGALLLGFCAPRARAQELPTLNAPTGAALADRLGGGLDARLDKGRDLLAAGDPTSASFLRDAAQDSLKLLQTTAQTDVLSAAPGSLPGDSLTLGLATQAAQAHLLWGIAAEKFAGRDEAITALSRAQRLVLAPADAPGQSILRRDISLELTKQLTDGLPLVAPTDVLSDVAQLMHGDRWTPRAFSFSEPSDAPLNGPAAPRELLITDGDLFPPPAPGEKGISPRTPALYGKLSEQQLPSSLKLNKMVAGYARETSGPNAGQWRLQVRVFYASQFLTEGRRFDLPRARALAQAFLKVQALYADHLGLSNLYSSGDRDAGVTTLWLLEVSALWPSDDSDPRVLAQLGPLMPNVNIGPNTGVVTPKTTALVRPWTPIAGHLDSAPSEILFWKAAQDRPEAEWLRELFHEYGHVAIPPFGGFAPPLETYANGDIGETLGMLWAAKSPAEFVPSLPVPPGAMQAQTVATGGLGTTASEQGARADLRDLSADHVRSHALIARALFVAAGPNSPLASATNETGVNYLTGAATYLERVYGGPMLGRALQPLAVRARQTENVAARRSLLRTPNLFEAMNVTWSSTWNADKTLPIWLPGALGVNLDAQTLIDRGNYALRAGTRAPVLLWVPPGTGELRIEGAGAGNLSVLGTPFSANGNVARIFFTANGWQRLTLVAGANVSLGTARFVRK